jgi:hypothetical protein
MREANESFKQVNLSHAHTGIYLSYVSPSSSINAWREGSMGSGLRALR